MSRKRTSSGPNSQANMLRDAGFPALGTIKKSFNPISFLNANRTGYELVWRNYDINQNCAFLVWDGLPNGLTSWNLNRMLYFRGSVVGFKFAGEVYVLPYTIEDGLNIYGSPVAVRPITYTGEAPGKSASNNTYFADNFKLRVDKRGNERDDADVEAVILYDGAPWSPSGKALPRYASNTVIISEMAEVMASININVRISRKKIYFKAKDANQAEVIRMEIAQSFGSDAPFEVIAGDMPFDEVQQTGDFMAQELFETLRNFDNFRCFVNGIKSKAFGTEKKEHLLTGEMLGNDVQSSLIGDLRLEFAEKWAEDMNKYFGTNISVRRRDDDYTPETDGNNLLPEEEERGKQ